MTTDRAASPTFSEQITRSLDNDLRAKTIVDALYLLAHWWSRPEAEEVLLWISAEGLFREVHQRLSPAKPMIALPLEHDDAEIGKLLEEYERIFVGPGPVPCPPYESFWRQDVPVDIRRSLMGPCTAELNHIYGELEIQQLPGFGELPDYIAVELEALGYSISLQSSQAFARQLYFDHLKRWLPKLCRAVRHEANHPFYRLLAGISAEWITHVERFLEPVPPVDSIATDYAVE